MLDWESFLQQYGIDYRPSSSRGDVRVACPFCQDSGAPNMSINLNGRGWRCWKNPDHRGRYPAPLLVALTRISLTEARLLCGPQLKTSQNPAERVRQLLTAPATTAAPLQELRLPKEFKPFTKTPLAAPFIAYLVGRGFHPNRVLRFTKDYGLYYCRRGRWRYRIVFSIVQGGQLHGWTGRSIAPEPLRYLAAGHDDGALPTTDTLLWFDQLTGGKRLLLCEGPFDALKLRELGEQATCCFTAAPGRRQIDLLREVLPRYRQRVLLLDRGTVATALMAQRSMAGLNVDITILRQHKDPATINSRAELDSVLAQG